MARSKAHRPQHPSNVRVRRAAHLTHAADLRERKRLRRTRREERDRQLAQTAQAMANLELAAALDQRALIFSYRSTDKRVDGQGWQVLELAEDGTTIGEIYASSRDGARKLAREQNIEREATL